MHASEELARALVGLPVFAQLSLDDAATLARGCFVVELQHEELLFAEGQAPDHLYVLLAGEAQISCLTASGDEVVVGRAHPGAVLGEMGLLYPLAGRLFIGGTLTDRGGHTPFEPAAYATALLHGPDVANHAAPFARLAAAHAAIEVTDATALAEALTRLAASERQDALGRAAQETLQPATDMAQLVAAITQRLDPPE